MLPSCESDWTTASSRATITKRNISQVASEWLVYVVSWHAWELTRHINSRFVMQLWLREVVKCVGYESSDNLGRQAELWERRTQIIIRSQKLREQKPKIDIASKEGRKSWHLSIYTGTPTKIDDKMQKGSWKLFGTCVPIYLLSLLTCENAGVPSLRIRLFVLSSVFKHASRQNQSTWSSTQCFTTGLFGNDLKSGVSWVNFVISLPVDHNITAMENIMEKGMVIHRRWHFFAQSW